MTENSPTDVVIVDAVRTPSGRGRTGGALAEVHPVDLLAQTIETLLQRSPALDPGTVDDVMVGCVSQVGEQSATPGRMAWLGAGLPAHVPATTIDRKCGSSQQAVHFAAQAIASGQADVVVAGGVESMSRVVMGSARMGADPYGVRVAERFAPGLVSQGVAAELVAARWKLSRAELDDYSVRSHELAAAAQDSGAFDREVIAVDTPGGPVARDETIRRGTTSAKLGELRAVFETPELAARFPEIDWSVTAGNSSQITDGASALLVMSRAHADRLGLTPRARVHSMAVVGDDPLLMLTGPIPATHKVLDRAGVALADIEHIELNEAFAPVPLAWLAEFDVDPARVNPRGGAIALGHPLGASGTRLMTTMLHALEDNDQRFGLQLMCEAGGMANATLIERL
ncbi:acetyl-CoA C-acyltransferase [Pimelobacter simplex]|uniref:Acetyl-CoA acetyltransferase n=1 Tax=Nocardioides simplex TaxID=2045 RepID=A0A0A1DQI3_NOCSI|nr:thiolase family protein [Pimelobacter simplex]AIY18813.1 acetyl-CoA acetyltransferase [Pimelobacter simplex]MCG8152405.1 acetyl-CoA C-acyltransferase [Pimelobacter simplex]GEB14519.1 putative acyl-CoA thiolase [Pimelobacter simplex]SFM28740.1 acetyl-CoA C-acetyltransferase/acetyl-CoA acyltransferase [Pimelobacter simplex]